MSVAISDMQAVSFTCAVWKERLLVQMQKKKKKKNQTEISMLWGEGETDGRITALSLWDMCPLCTMASKIPDKLQTIIFEWIILFALQWKGVFKKWKNNKLNSRIISPQGLEGVVLTWGMW